MKTKEDWLKELKKIAAYKGGQCFSTVYVNAHFKLHFKCSEGHVWSARPSSILRGTWCSKCAISEQHKQQRTPYIEITSIIKEKNGKVLSDEKTYLNKNGEITVLCENGHQFKTKGKYLKVGNWCNICGRVNASSKLRLDISVPKKLAEERGGILLNEKYNGNSEKLKWKCKAGHTWLATYANVARGTWCRECSLVISISERIVRLYFEKITEIEMPSAWPSWLINSDGNQMELDGYNEDYRIAFEHHGTQHYIESKYYKGITFEKRIQDDKTKEEICKKNNVRLLIVREVLKTTSLEQLKLQIESFALENNLKIKENVTSEEFSINNLYAIDPLDRFREICLSRGGKLLDTEWRGYKHKYTIVCANKHQWKTSGAHLLNRRWCPECKWVTIAAKNTKYTIEDMKKLAQEKNGKCLSKKYLGLSVYLDWECSEGHQWKAWPSNILSGKWCRKCSIIKNSDAQRGNLENCINAAKEHNGICLSKNYVNAREKLAWKCERGHNFNLTADEVINRGSWCKKCSNINKRYKSPLYQKLIELAKAGKPRPNKESSDPQEKQLGNALSNYLKNDKAPEFFQLAPHWFKKTK